jgi:hypothetical protein
MRRLLLIALAAAIAATPALAATRSEHKFKLAFTKTTTSSPTGTKFVTDRFNYKAPAQGTLADRVETTTFVMAPGTRTNVAAYPACTTAKLKAGGASACPSASLVGSGSATVITGNPIIDSSLKQIKAQVFTKRGGLIAFLPAQNQVIEMAVAANRVVAKVPRTCLDPTDCSKGEAVLKVLSVTLKPGKLIVTPSKCPASRKWTNKAVYKYANKDTEVETSTSPCKG